MTTYRTGNHWGVTIVAERAAATPCGHAGPEDPGHDLCAQLVAVVVNGDQALAERICALLNGNGGVTRDRINAARGIVPMTLEQARQVVAAVLDLRPDADDAYPHRCPGCGNHYRTAEAAGGCDADHHAAAERIRTAKEPKP